MNHDIFQSDTNNNICEVDGCSAKATDEITVHDGTFGNIKLLLCSNCVSKFSCVTKIVNELPNTQVFRAEIDSQ